MNGNASTPQPRRKRRWWLFLLLTALAILAVLLMTGGPRVMPRTVLVIDVTGKLPERGGDDLARMLGAPDIDIPSTVKALRMAALDPRVEGVLLRLRGGSLEAAQVEELRDLLEGCRRSGKLVLAHATGPDTLAYFLSTAAGEIVLDPSSTLDAIGIQARAVFLKDALASLGVEADLVRVGDFKGAYEELALSAPTPEFESTMEGLMDSLYESIVEGVSEARKIDLPALRATLDRCPMEGDEALSEKLVDRLEFAEGLRGLFQEKVGQDASFMDVERYLEAAGGEASGEKCLALIHVIGLIVEGESRSLPWTGVSTGADTVVEALEAATDRPDVAGVLLRVDSPGGVVSAAEKIFHAVDLARKQKPVVASMGGKAASGGYYVACAAERVFAQRTTITGSIGIFGGKLVLEDLLERSRVSTRTYSRGKRAGMYDFSRRFSIEERLVLKETLENHYRRFVDRVARSRKKSFAEIQAVAQGKVWTGREAVEIGLVDSIGGFQEALEALRDLARLHGEPPLRLFPPRKTVWDYFRGSKGRRLVLDAVVGTGARDPLGLEAWVQDSGLFRPYVGLALLPLCLDLR